MQAQNETSPSISTETQGLTPAEPQVIDTQSPVPEPMSPEQTIQEPVSAVGSENTPQNISDTVPEFDEQALEAILDQIVASNPEQPKFTFKEDKPDDQKSPDTPPAPVADEKKEGEVLPIDPADKVILDELAEVAEIYSNENKKFQEENQNLRTTLDTTIAEKQEAIEIANAVDSIWKDIVSQIPILDQYADAKTKGEAFELPPIYREEVQKALQEHPIVGPLNRAIINGEDLPIAAFVKSLADYRRSTAPQIADTKTSVPVNENSKSVSQNRLGGLRGVRPVTAI